jgi:DinB superfamily
MIDSSQKQTVERLLAILRQTPLRLAELAADEEETRLCASPGLDEWSSRDILAHLRACANVWGGYIERIISEDEPSFRYVSPRTWIRKTNYLETSFQSSLEAFVGQRIQLLSILEPLPPDAWQRSANVTKNRKPQVMSVTTFAEMLAVHEGLHIGQVERLVRGSS